jgi:hypothetical protein
MGIFVVLEVLGLFWSFFFFFGDILVVPRVFWSV